MENLPVKIIVFNLLGENVYTKTLSNTATDKKVLNTAIQLQDSNISKGLYFITITNGTESFSKKLIFE